MAGIDGMLFVGYPANKRAGYPGKWNEELGTSRRAPELMRPLPAERTRNVQVIDAALNATYDVFAITEEDFRAVFPAPEQDIEFADDLFARLGAEGGAALYARMWIDRVPKPSVKGIPRHVVR